MYEDITYSESSHVATITIDRPRSHNALRYETYDELQHALETTEARAVIITGAGQSFCAGDDMKEILSKSPSESPRTKIGLTGLARTLLTLEVPTICAVNGAAMGWGMHLAVLCDFRIASERARFAELFVKRGIVADVAGLGRLPSLVGRENALRLLLTGEVITANTALDMGLVGQVVDHDDLLSTASELASMIAANPPLAVKEIKRGFSIANDIDYEALGSWFANTLFRLRLTHDHKEAIDAFFEKRSPTFNGI